jgi:hypothetical protein
MIEPSVELKTGPRLRPGESLIGTVRWRDDQAPTQAHLCLRWCSRSDEHEDIRVISTVSLARLPRADGYGAIDPYRPLEDAGEELPLEARDARCFCLPMPAEPYSFRGRLVRLDWELIVDFPLARWSCRSCSHQAERRSSCSPRSRLGALADTSGR